MPLIGTDMSIDGEGGPLAALSETCLTAMREGIAD